MCRYFRRTKKLKYGTLRRIRSNESAEWKEKGITMKYLRYVALLALLMLPVTYSQASVRVGIGIGVGPGYVAGPPVCSYGYYPDYPYTCAPYGYYGPSWFSSGVFIGAGPWYHGWGHPIYPAYGRGFVGRGFEGRGFDGRGRVVGRGYVAHGRAGGSRGGFHGGGFRGGR
jgi:hypothetical protein